MNLLAKLEGVKVSNISRLSPSDLAYCQRQQALYTQAVNFFTEMKEKMAAIYATYSQSSDSYRSEGYIDRYDDIRHLEDRIPKIKTEYIDRIIYYFEKAYKVSIEHSSIREKYKDAPPLEPTFEQIAEEIFVQLGGYTFHEKAINEIKVNFSKHVGCRMKPEIKGVRLILDNYVWVEQNKDYSDPRGKRKIAELSYRSDSKLYDLFRALTHFETEMVEAAMYYQQLSYSISRNRKYAFEKYELGYNKVQSIRIYKTGKIEVAFESYEQAEAFLRTYYVQQ